MKKVQFYLLLSSFTFTQVFAGTQEDLVTACLQSDKAAAEKAIAAGADVNGKDESGNTPICASYFFNNILLESLWMPLRIILSFLDR